MTEIICKKCSKPIEPKDFEVTRQIRERLGKTYSPPKVFCSCVIGMMLEWAAEGGDDDEPTPAPEGSTCGQCAHFDSKPGRYISPRGCSHPDYASKYPVRDRIVTRGACSPLRRCDECECFKATDVEVTT